MATALDAVLAAGGLQPLVGVVRLGAALRSVALTPVAFAVVAALALMNGLFGMLATWRLWALPPDAD